MASATAAAMSSCCGRDSNPGSLRATNPPAPRTLSVDMGELWPARVGEVKAGCRGRRGQRTEARGQEDKFLPGLWLLSSGDGSPEPDPPVVVRGGVAAEVPVAVLPLQRHLPP